MMKIFTHLEVFGCHVGLSTIRPFSRLRSHLLDLWHQILEIHTQDIFENFITLYLFREPENETIMYRLAID
jgi:hypothetical protein